MAEETVAPAGPVRVLPLETASSPGMDEVPEAQARGPSAKSRAADERSFGEKPSPAPAGSAEAYRRPAGTRLLGKVLEVMGGDNDPCTSLIDVGQVEPLVCPRCFARRRRVEMKILAWITNAAVVDRILRHRRERRQVSVFETPPARAPPAA